MKGLKFPPPGSVLGRIVERARLRAVIRHAGTEHHGRIYVRRDREKDPDRGAGGPARDSPLAPDRREDADDENDGENVEQPFEPLQDLAEDPTGEVARADLAENRGRGDGGKRRSAHPQREREAEENDVRGIHGASLTHPTGPERGARKYNGLVKEIAADRALGDALDDLILGRGVARGRHRLVLDGRNVTAEFLARLEGNGFRPVTVREAPIEEGERIPAFCVRGDVADFGYIRWEVFTPRSRRKLFASERRDPGNDEWAVQINLGSAERVWADAQRKERHDVETVVPVIR